MADEVTPLQLESEDFDFLTQEQRIDAIAEILSTIALRVVTKDNEPQELTLS